MFEYTVTLSSAYTGKDIKVKVESTNVIGSTLSPSTLFTLADVPDKPEPAPTVINSLTTTTAIRIDFTNTNSANNGGAPISFVEVWMDDGN